MGNSIVICEKGSQAQDIKKAVGSKYGEVLPAEGHLLTLAEPEDVNPAWQTWGYDLLLPDGLFYPLALPKPTTFRFKERMEKLKRIQAALKTASTVYIATDCDREGQLIGEEILQWCGYKGRVLRCIFTAQDPKTLQKAFAEAKPNEQYQHMYRAAFTRQQMDQIYNLSLTRAATTAYRKPGQRGVVGVGRVKSAALAIAAIRELEIRNFKPEDYFEVEASCAVAAGSFRMMHAPRAELRISDRKVAEAIRAAAEGWTGPLTVKVTDERRAPPRLMDLPALQKACSSKFGWDADKTLAVAQSCYMGDCAVTTYPRAEARYLAENQIEEVPTLLAALRGLDMFDGLPEFSPVIRKGKAGHFSDKALEGLSHHAIIPNVNVADELARRVAALDADQRKFFDLVARSYMAAVMPDYEYRKTDVSAEVAVPGMPKPALFRTTGAIPVKAGWKAVYEDIDEDAGEDNAKLPPMKNGDAGALSDAKVLAKQTQPPPRYTDGTLIEKMQNAWQLLPPGELQDKLKEAKGIGTPATRGDVIAGLKKQGFLEKKGKHTVPTAAGLAYFRHFHKELPNLVNPVNTAQWEMHLERIEKNELTPEQMIKAIAKETKAAIERIQATAGAFEGASNANSKPSPKMVKAVETIAARKGLTPPKGFKSSFDACKAFLDQHMEKRPEGEAGKPWPPSEKQVALAIKLCEEHGVMIPAGALADGKALSAWIDDVMKKHGRPPSPKQLEWVEKICGEKNIEPPAGYREDAGVCKAFLDKHFGSGGGKKSGTAGAKGSNSLH